MSPQWRASGFGERSSRRVPSDLTCPTLWLVGSANENTMRSLDEYRGHLATTNVTLETVVGLNHAQEFTEMDKVLAL